MTLIFSTPGQFEWMIIVIICLPFLVAKIIYLHSLKLTLESISQENRKLAPGNVWLNLIPVFGTVYHFIIVEKIAESLKAEFKSRNIKLQEIRPTYNLGIAVSVLNCLVLFPGINYLAVIGWLVCWILYWQKVVSYRDQLLIFSQRDVGFSI